MSNPPSYLGLVQQGPVVTPAITVNSTAVALGSNASVTKPTTNSSGSYAATAWQTATAAGQAAAKSVKMSATGQYQLLVTAGAVYLSQDSGATFTAVAGLPAGIAWLNGSVSSSGQYMTLTEINGVWVSSDYGVTFAMSKAGAPTIWLKFENNTADSGSAGITPTDTVYLYCFKGARASNTFVALKEAGFNSN